MKPLKILLLTIVILFTMTGCCWTDHSETIKEVAEPMLEQLDAFYKKNRRHPNKKERDKMLLASGCSKVEKEMCSFGWKKIKVERSKISNTGAYNMTLNHGDTYCHFGVFYDGNIKNIACFNTPCIDWGR